MKIIRAGKREEAPWWVGLCAMCGNCGEVIEFELDDRKGATFLETPSPDARVEIRCPCCANVINMKRTGVYSTNENSFSCHYPLATLEEWKEASNCRICDLRTIKVYKADKAQLRAALKNALGAPAIQIKP